MAIERAWPAAAAAALMALAGCAAVGPDYQRPELAAPPDWHAGEAARDGALAPADADIASRPVERPLDTVQWWTVFADPVLDGLVRDAARQNLDVQTAALRIEIARAQARTARAARLPSVEGSGVAGRMRSSENGLLGGGGGGGGGSGGGGSGGGGGSSSGGGGSSTPSTTNLFDAGFDATWELDLWGGVRRNVEAAEASTRSAEEQRRDALVSLSAEIARTYLGLRAGERQLAIAEADVRTQQRLAELVASRRRAGLAPQSDVVAQAAQVQAALAQLPPLRQQLMRARNRLALLLALPPGALAERLGPQPAAGPRPLPPEVPVGLPADLLRRRADIRRAEADLQAATAQVGVATAKLFPTVRLGVAGGFQASQFSDLADWASRFLLGGVQVSIPLIEGGRLKAQREVAGLQQQQAVLAYRQAVLNAFHEVDDALGAYAETQRRTRALERQWQEAGHARELAQARWRSGLGSFIEVLDAERTAHQAEQQLSQGTADAETGLVALYKALGGGWEVLAPLPPQAAQGSDR